MYALGIPVVLVKSDLSVFSKRLYTFGPGALYSIVFF